MRLFVAVNFPGPVRRSLARVTARLAEAGLPVRWTSEEAFHLTLRWLGDRDDYDRAVVTAILYEVAAGFEPFEAGFGPVGAFPSPRRPRVIWIAVEAGARLRLLRDERSFHPHVTLGRARRDSHAADFRPFASLRADIGVAVSFPVASVDLMQSHLHRDGARYERLEAAALGPEGLPADEPPA